jgi:signal transduction histidine kinase
LGNSLNQVWTNILDNAIDATGGTGTISIRTRHEQDTVVVEFEDDGTGIAPDDLARIFEPFFTTKPQGQGTGLGLDTVWRIVTEEHGGTIAVESEPGRTVFRVMLPLAQAGPGGTSG